MRLLQGDQGVVPGHRLAVRARVLGRVLDQVHEGIQVGKHQPLCPRLPHRRKCFSHGPGHHRLDERTAEILVERLVPDRYLGDGAENRLVLAAIGLERQDVVHLAQLETHRVVTVLQFLVTRGSRLLVDDHLVQARRQALDQLQRVYDLVVLLACDALPVKMPRCPIFSCSM